MRNYLTLILFVILVSCSNSNPPIYYKCNGVIITRLDEINGEAESHFFYGYYDGKTPYPKSFIKSTYHGFDAEMDGYLIFLPNNKVEFVGKDGWFEKIGNDTNLNIKEFQVNGSFDNGMFITWHDSIQNKYGNIEYFTSYDSSDEKADNVKNHSFIKAEYTR